MPAEQSTIPVEYRDIPGFPGYQVGDDWSFRSRRDRHGRFTDRWHPIKPYRRTTGARYFVICLRPERNGKLCQRYVHRLVLEAFVGPCPPGLVCCHNDGDTSNNRPSNLRWDTVASNRADTARHGRSPIGSRNHGAKLIESDIPKIRRLAALGISHAKIGRGFAVSPSIVGSIVRRKTWRHVS